MDELSIDFSVTESTEFVLHDHEPTEAVDLFDEFFEGIRRDSPRIQDTFSNLYDYNNERGRALAAALRTNTHVRRITLVITDLCFPITEGVPKVDYVNPRVFREILEATAKNLITGIKEIKLQGCGETKDEHHLSSDANTKAIAWLMTERPGLLQKLQLRSGFIKHSVFPLVAAILMPQNQLLHLDLSHNTIDDDGAHAISKMLQKNDCSLLYLNLKGNFIRENGIDLLADSLARNRSLQVMDVSYNRFYTDSVVRFANSLRVNRSLEEVYLLRRYELTQEASTREVTEFVTTLRLNKKLVCVEHDRDELANADLLGRMESLLRRNRLIHDMYHVWRPKLYERKLSPEEDAFLIKVCAQAMTTLGKEGPIFFYFFIRETPLTNYLFENGAEICRRLDDES